MIHNFDPIRPASRRRDAPAGWYHSRSEGSGAQAIRNRTSRRAAGVSLGGPVSGQQRVRRATPVRAHPQGQRRGPRHPHRCAWSAGKTGSYIGAQFHRLHRRFGKKGGGKAAVAVAHTFIVIVWHVLNDQSECRELGHDYFTRRDNPETAKRRLIHNLEALGYRVNSPPPPEQKPKNPTPAPPGRCCLPTHL